MVGLGVGGGEGGNGGGGAGRVGAVGAGDSEPGLRRCGVVYPECIVVLFRWVDFDLLLLGVRLRNFLSSMFLPFGCWCQQLMRVHLLS